MTRPWVTWSSVVIILQSTAGEPRKLRFRVAQPRRTFFVTAPIAVISVKLTDPQFEGLADTGALLASRALAEGRTALAAGNLDRADVLARAATDAGGATAETADLAAKIMAARVSRPAAVSTPEPAVLPENRLNRTFFAPPSYPTRARERGTEGWVDLEFTVTRDGTTRDAVVRAAEPAGVFDRAALDAVKRWRYEPRVVGGNVVEQRVEARLRFRLAE